jgi:hypothetical protein
MSRGNRNNQPSNLDGMEMVQESEMVLIPQHEGGPVSFSPGTYIPEIEPSALPLLGTSEAGGLDEATTRKVQHGSSDSAIQRSLMGRLWRRGLRFAGGISLVTGIVIIVLALGAKDPFSMMGGILVGLVLITLPLFTPND